MTNPLRVATAAVVGVVVVAGALYAISPGSPFGGPSSTPTPVPSAATPSLTPTQLPTSQPIPSLDPSASPKAVSPDTPMAAGRYYEVPFGPGGMDLCFGQAGCTEDPKDEAMRFTFTVPSGWVGGSVHVLYASEGKAPPAGAGLVISRGGGLYAEPCGDEPPPNILVGPTVDDFVSALVAHPKLDVTAPVDVSLAGYTGKYLDLQVPADITACSVSYFPWEPGIFAQGPGSRWHLWVLDVDGIRVVIQSTDYEGTSAARRAELLAIVESIEIEP
ncbi:MAG TPA: hypothetical protein VIF63_04995 [Candidatus Limnocylindrales bacterium]|jgi:hypothetical protein